MISFFNGAALALPSVTIGFCIACFMMKQKGKAFPLGLSRVLLAFVISLGVSGFLADTLESSLSYLSAIAFIVITFAVTFGVRAVATPDGK